MGHERVGTLPHSKRWRDVVAQMASLSGTAEETADLAEATLNNVRSSFRNIHTDDGVVAAFQFLVALTKSTALSDSLPPSESPLIDFDRSPTTLRLVSELRSWVDQHQGSKEYADLAKKASADAMVSWSEQHKQQPSLFADGNESEGVWRSADNGAGFCEVARLFFSKFTERYLNYFLGREASSAAGSVQERDSLETQLRSHVDGVSRYAFESARITQSFAAGWFNQHARDSVPTDSEIRGFLAVAFGKMREELLRGTSER